MCRVYSNRYAAASHPSSPPHSRLNRNAGGNVAPSHGASVPNPFQGRRMANANTKSTCTLHVACCDTDTELTHRVDSIKVNVTHRLQCECYECCEYFCDYCEYAELRMPISGASAFTGHLMGLSHCRRVTLCSCP